MLGRAIDSIQKYSRDFFRRILPVYQRASRNRCRQCTDYPSRIDKLWERQQLNSRTQTTTMSRAPSPDHLDLWASSIEDFRPPFDNDRLQSWSTNFTKVRYSLDSLPGQYYRESLGTCEWHRVTSVILHMTWAAASTPTLRLVRYLWTCKFPFMST
jgi:hypothetical protein